MRGLALLALVGMLPASLNAAPPAAMTLEVPLCAGAARAIRIPMRGDAPAREDGQPCCGKGCHAGGSRKRHLRHC